MRERERERERERDESTLGDSIILLQFTRTSQNGFMLKGLTTNTCKTLKEDVKTNTQAFAGQKC